MLKSQQRQYGFVYQDLVGKFRAVSNKFDEMYDVPEIQQLKAELTPEQQLAVDIKISEQS